MEIEIDSKKNNALLNRTEVHFTVRHGEKGTPDRELIRNELAGKLNVKKEDVIVNYIHSGFGSQESTGYAKIYTSLDNAKGLEKRHILERNKLVEKREKKKEEKKKAEKPPSKAEAEKKPAVASTAKPPAAEEKKESAKESKKESGGKPAEEKK